MKKILAYVTPDTVPSMFDIVVAHDSGADIVMPYGSVDENHVEDIIHGCVFTRRKEDLKNTAVFIGGKNSRLSEALLRKSLEVIGQLPAQFRISIGVDPEGANTTSSACVAKIADAFDVSGSKAAVVAGTGPVGERSAALLANEGAEVTLTSRKIESAKATCRRIRDMYDCKAEPAVAASQSEIEKVLSTAEIVLATGSEGVQLVQERSWLKYDNVKVIADCNAVPPYGIEGVRPTDNGKVDGRIRFGALTIGGLKMKVQYRIVEDLFKSNDKVINLGEAYAIAKAILKTKR
ncbi:MAG: methylene-tetrahydromethanopterin dehydrogenase N-terminal domain-containing protein [Candidatus Altiarchaeota archaeon]